MTPFSFAMLGSSVIIFPCAPPLGVSGEDQDLEEEQGEGEDEEEVYKSR